MSHREEPGSQPVSPSYMPYPPGKRLPGIYRALLLLPLSQVILLWFSTPSILPCTPGPKQHLPLLPSCPRGFGVQALSVVPSCFCPLPSLALPCPTSGSSLFPGTLDSWGRDLENQPGLALRSYAHDCVSVLPCFLLGAWCALMGHCTVTLQQGGAGRASS